MASSRKMIVLSMLCIIAGISALVLASIGIPRLRYTNISRDSLAISTKLKNQGTLHTFNTLDDITTFFEENQSSGRNIFFREAFTFATPTTGIDTLGSSKSSTSDYSSTNVQVEGVDEGDIIKTDGNFIYTLSSDQLTIVDARHPEQPILISQQSFSGTAHGMLLNHDRLAIFHDGNTDDPILQNSFSRSSSVTFVTLYNIQNPQTPKKLHTLSFEGNYQESRLMNDTAYLITQSNPRYPILQENSVLPVAMSDNTILPIESHDVYYVDMPYDSVSMTSVAAINLANDNGDIRRNVYVLPEGHATVYVSPTNLYLAFTKYINERTVYTDAARKILEPMADERIRERITAIEHADSLVLTENEKKEKIAELLGGMLEILPEKTQTDIRKKIDHEISTQYIALKDQIEQTVIHRIALDGTTMKPTSIATIPGYVLNQFSMDENEGYLRVATTYPGFSPWIQDRQQEQSVLQSTSGISIIDASGTIVGNLKDLAPGQQIYAARFMQHRAYLVTFQRTDPLFVIDCQDPKNPKVLGELHIPGFSEYLHPYDDTTLIGVGRDTIDVDGRMQIGGIKLALFDVANVEKPTEIQHVILGGQGSSSEVLNDHKAFLFSLNKHLLVLPVELWENTNSEESSSIRMMPSITRGAIVFDVTKENGFTNRGRIEHQTENTTSTEKSFTEMNTIIRRSLYIGDVLFTLSDEKLMAHDLPTLTELAKITL